MYKVIVTDEELQKKPVMYFECYKELRDYFLEKLREGYHVEIDRVKNVEEGILVSCVSDGVYVAKGMDSNSDCDN